MLKQGEVDMSTVFAWQMQQVGQPMQRVQGELPEPAEEEVRVRVAGCGVCHTDPGFFSTAFPP